MSSKNIKTHNVSATQHKYNQTDQSGNDIAARKFVQQNFQDKHTFSLSFCRLFIRIKTKKLRIQKKYSGLSFDFSEPISLCFSIA